MRYQKSNGWVLIRVYTARTIQQGWNELGTLPVGYRPEGDLYFPAQVSSLEARGYISSSGRVALYHFSATITALKVVSIVGGLTGDGQLFIDGR